VKGMNGTARPMTGARPAALPVIASQTYAGAPSATVTMAHGGGGRAMRGLIEKIFLPAFDNPVLASLEDQARLSLAELAALGDRLAFTTDTYVVTPIEFPGGREETTISGQPRLPTHMSMRVSAAWLTASRWSTTSNSSYGPIRYA